MWRLLNERPIFLWAQAIAFKVLVTTVPLVILTTGILGQVLRQEQAFFSVAVMIRNFLPPYRSDQLIEFLEQFARASNTVTLIGIGGLLFAAVTLMSTLRLVVSSVFQEEWHESRSVVKGYAFDIRMVVQVGVFFLLSITLSLAMQTVNASGPDILRRIGLNYAWIQEGWGRVFALLGLILPLLLSTAMFAQLFYFVPKPHPPRRSAVIGALVSAFLWEIVKHAFAFYAARAGRFDRYFLNPSNGVPAPDDGSISLAVGSVFGLVVAFVFWVYYSGLVMIIGAIITFLNEKRYRTLRRKRKVRAKRTTREETPGGIAADSEAAEVEAEEQNHP